MQKWLRKKRQIQCHQMKGISSIPKKISFFPKPIFFHNSSCWCFPVFWPHLPSHCLSKLIFSHSLNYCYILTTLKSRLLGWRLLWSSTYLFPAAFFLYFSTKYLHCVCLKIQQSQGKLNLFSHLYSQVPPPLKNLAAFL